MDFSFRWRQYQQDHHLTGGYEEAVSHWRQRDPQYQQPDPNRNYITSEEDTFMSLSPEQEASLDTYTDATYERILSGKRLKRALSHPSKLNPLYSNGCYNLSFKEFNTGYYLLMNPDVPASKASEAYAHYVKYGKMEHRKVSIKPELVPYWYSGSNDEWNKIVDSDTPWIRLQGRALRSNCSLKLPTSISDAELEELLRWMTLFGYRVQHFNLTYPSATLMLDFNQIGGTYFYSKSLYEHFTKYPIYRVIGFWGKYYLLLFRNCVYPIVYSGTQLETQIADWRKKQIIKSLFVNHPLSLDIGLLERLLGYPDWVRITVLHDYEWQQDRYKKCRSLFDLVIAQTESIGRVFEPLWRDKLILIPHPDYKEKQDKPVIYKSQKSGAPLRIAMIGAISPKKGARELQSLLPQCQKANVHIYVLGILDWQDFDYTPYLDQGVLTVESYEDINQFNELLLRYQPEALWYHNNIAHTMETWLYTLTLGLLTGLPLMVNNIPIFKERAPDAYFYQEGDVLSVLDQVRSKRANSIFLVKDRISYPRWYYKLFYFDGDRYLLKHLNSLPIGTPPKEQLLSYLTSDTYVPLLTEFDPVTYQKTYQDLSHFKTGSELYQHWLTYGIKEGRLPNSYRGLYKQPLAPHHIIRFYKSLALFARNHHGKQPLKYDPQRKCAMVFFETRPTQLFESVTRLMLARARNRANLYVFCTKRNEASFREVLPEVEAKYIVLDLPETINMDTYSHLLKQASFWENLSEEHIITYQTDSFPLQNIPWDILMKCPYSFLGAWHYQSTYGYFNINTPKGFGVNGGFSYRRRSFLLRCIANVTDQNINDYRAQHGFHKYLVEIPEDCYYYHGLELLELPCPSTAFCDKYFVQDRPPSLVTPSSLFGYHGIFYGNIDLGKLQQLTQLLRSFS